MDFCLKIYDELIGQQVFVKPGLLKLAAGAVKLDRISEKNINYTVENKKFMLKYKDYLDE